MNNTFSIKTLGCKMNQFESLKIAEHFINMGWKSVPFGKSSDVVIINTCTVTDKSDKKCRNYIRQGVKYSNKNGVIVTGCLVDRDGIEVTNIPGVLGIFKNKEKDRLYDSIMELPQYNNSDPVNIQTVGLNSHQKYTRGLLKIQDGCDGKCTYCIIPTVRGLPVSKNEQELVNEARALIDSGYPEIVLTGITIGKYLSNGVDLAAIVKKIVDIEGDFRVRITSIEPGHVTDKFSELFLNPKICNHIHIPLQSGSDKILEKMQRPYRRKEYLEIIEKLYLIAPEMAIGTDIILGFPGETEEDFNENLSILDEAGFAFVHQFTYSRRSGTPAAEFPNQCDSSIVENWSQRLRLKVEKAELLYRRKFLEKKLLSVIEKNKSGYSATAGNYIKMKLNNSKLPDSVRGKILPVRLLDPEKSIGEIIF